MLLFQLWSKKLAAPWSWNFWVFLFFFSAESQEQTNPIFKDYLPGSADVPQENKPVEPSLWKQTSHTQNLPPGLEYLNQVLSISEC